MPLCFWDVGGSFSLAAARILAAPTQVTMACDASGLIPLLANDAPTGLSGPPLAVASIPITTTGSGSATVPGHYIYYIYNFSSVDSEYINYYLSLSSHLPLAVLLTLGRKFFRPDVPLYSERSTS